MQFSLVDRPHRVDLMCTRPAPSSRPDCRVTSNVRLFHYIAVAA
jgi:hypothetical protein